MSDQTSSRAVFSLIFGILSFNGCPCIGAILAIMLGSGETSGVGRAGVILGWVHLAMIALALVAIAGFALVGAIANAGN